MVGAESFQIIWVIGVRPNLITPNLITRVVGVSLRGRGRKNIICQKKRKVLSNLAEKCQINVFDVPTCPTISLVVGHSNIVGPLLSTWGKLLEAFLWPCSLAVPVLAGWVYAFCGSMSRNSQRLSRQWFWF